MKFLLPESIFIVTDGTMLVFKFFFIIIGVDVPFIGADVTISVFKVVLPESVFVHCHRWNGLVFKF